jgi:AraC-like DNA-binding protein
MPTLTERITSTQQGMRIWQQERLVYEVTERICELLFRNQMSRAELADALGKSPSHVTHILTGNANMTLHTVADLFWACGRAAHITDEPIETSTTSPMMFYMDAEWREANYTVANVESRFELPVTLGGSQGTSLSEQINMVR